MRARTAFLAEVERTKREVKHAFFRLGVFWRLLVAELRAGTTDLPFYAYIKAVYANRLADILIDDSWSSGLWQAGPPQGQPYQVPINLGPTPPGLCEWCHEPEHGELACGFFEIEPATYEAWRAPVETWPCGTPRTGFLTHAQAAEASGIQCDCTNKIPPGESVPPLPPHASESQANVPLPRIPRRPRKTGKSRKPRKTRKSGVNRKSRKSR